LLADVNFHASVGEVKKTCWKRYFWDATNKNTA